MYPHLPIRDGTSSRKWNHTRWCNEKTTRIGLHSPCNRRGIIDHANAYPHNTVENVGHIQIPSNANIEFIDIHVDKDDNVTTFINRRREKYHWLVSDWDTIRDKRNKLLSSCDWTHTTDVELTGEQKHKWAMYRKSLREITTSFQHPSDVIWPEM